MNAPASDPRPAAPRGSGRNKVLGLLLLVVALAVVVAMWTYLPKRVAPAPAVRSVAVIPVARRNLYQELTIEAEFRPYQQVQLYSKVTGYLKTITVDFGDRVKAGQPIATIEVPELQDELDQAVAAERRAAADYHNTHLDYTRLSEVNRTQPNLISQQDLDNSEARDAATAAAVAGAKADVEKYQTLIGYTTITAPFDGVVTARSADPGAMIQAAPSPETLPVIQLSENQLLRLDFPVSVSVAGDMRIGDPVEIHLEGIPHILTAKITRFTRDISMATRTMLTEVEVPNPDLKLIPGMYASVVLKLHEHTGALAVPVEAVSATSSPTVDVVNPQGIVEERPVKLGLETGSYYQVLDGLQEGDLVIVGNRSGIQPGSKVDPKTIVRPSSP